MSIVSLIESLLRATEALEAMRAGIARGAVRTAAPEQAAAVSTLRASRHRALVHETFTQIALRYGISPYRLMAANPEWFAHALQPGDEIRIPGW